MKVWCEQCRMTFRVSEPASVQIDHTHCQEIKHGSRCNQRFCHQSDRNQGGDIIVGIDPSDVPQAMERVE